MALRKPLRLQPLQQAPQYRLSWEFQPSSFDQYCAPGESTMEFLEKLSIRIAMRAYCSPGAALRRLFRVISYSIWS
jgi:hypothetical protein